MRFLPKIDRKLLERWILSFIVLTNLMPVVDLAAAWGYRATIKSSYIQRRSYIKEIKGDMQSVNSTKKSLDYFNSLGNSSIVKYEEPDTLFTRPIIIEVRDFTMLENFLGYAGFAVPTPFECKITIQPFSDITMFEQVLIHEYLHCMGYLRHSNARNDIMYPSYRPVTEDNIKKYANELEDSIK